MLSEACRSGSCIAASLSGTHGCSCSDETGSRCVACQQAHGAFLADLDRAQDEQEKQERYSEASNSAGNNERETTMERFLDELRRKAEAAREANYELEQKLEQLEDAKTELESYADNLDNLISMVEEGIEDVSFDIDGFDFDSSNH